MGQVLHCRSIPAPAFDVACARNDIDRLTKPKHFPQLTIVAIALVHQPTPRGRPAAHASRICSSAVCGFVEKSTSSGTPALRRWKRYQFVSQSPAALMLWVL
jgi:hypothetical protein